MGNTEELLGPGSIVCTYLHMCSEAFEMHMSSEAFELYMCSEAFEMHMCSEAFEMHMCSEASKRRLVFSSPEGVWGKVLFLKY